MDTIKTVRNQSWLHPAFGVLATIAATAAVIVIGLPTLAPFALLPLLGLFWYWERLSPAEMGFVWGQFRHYGLALLPPVIVLSIIALAAWTTGAMNLENTDWASTAIEFVLTALITTLLAIGTEEGFFRGWLWSALRRAGQSKDWVVVLTSIAFAIWHLPIFLLDTGYEISLAQLPVLLINVSIIGVIWGMVRLISGSVVVSSVTHGLWNSATYVFFGFGAQAGALGIQETAIYGPEVGALGLVLSLVFAIGLWLWYRRADRMAAAHRIS